MDTTIDYFRDQGTRLAAHMAEEADHLHHKWGSHTGTADDLRDLSTVANDLAARFIKVAGDALEMAERLDPTWPTLFETPDEIFHRRLTVVDGCQGDS